MDFYKELIGVIDTLTDAKIDFALCGGVAVAFHGYTRFTKDIDLLILRNDLNRILDVVKQREFILKADKMVFGIGTSKEREICRISKIKGKEILTLDLVIVNQTLKEVWEKREIFEWEGRRVQVVSAKGLLTMKTLSARDQDILDIKKLGLMDSERKEDQ